MRNKIKFEKRNGLSHLIVENEHARCEILPEHGAHVMSYVPIGEEDVLWVSAESFFEKNRPVRGGIPICWPWFGAHPTDGTKPSHGFARIAEWTLDEIETFETGETAVMMSLSDDEHTLAIWPHHFNLTSRVVVGKTLRVELTTTNTSDSPFEITAALHSYFNVGDVRKISITGLEGTNYIDTIDENRTKGQTGAVTFDSEVDRIYIDTKADCVVHIPSMNREIRVSKEGSASTVVWNPWIAKAARMPDFGNEEYKEMVCVETTNALDDKRIVKPGASHSLVAEIAVSAY